MNIGLGLGFYTTTVLLVVESNNIYSITVLKNPLQRRVTMYVENFTWNNSNLNTSYTYCTYLYDLISSRQVLLV